MKVSLYGDLVLERAKQLDGSIVLHNVSINVEGGDEQSAQK